MNAQEQHWAGQPGSEYLKRNRVDWQARVPFWKSILDLTSQTTALEVGCNAGWNLRAIREAGRWVTLRGVDLNEEAVHEAQSKGLNCTVQAADKVGQVYTGCFDIVFTAGVLIHVAPEKLREVMASIVLASRQYVLAVEYDADVEEPITYRGQEGLLWKRPFGRLYEEMGLKPVSSGDAGDAFDRCTFWLFQKP